MKLEELSRILREIDPAAVLVPPPVLARVVQNVAGLNWTVWSVPHSHCYLVDRATLFKNVEQEELSLPPDHLLPDTVLLLERPSTDQLAGPKADLLSRYWRLLFHVTLHRELEQRLVGLTDAELRARIEGVGPAAFEEARNVLIQDNELIPRADDRAAYVEFAVWFLELKAFAPNLIPVYFPSLPSVAEVDEIVARDVDGAAVFRRTRPPGAPDPTPKTDDQSDESHDFFYRLSRSARRAAASGDTVGAAILHTRAARVAPAALTGPAQAAAREHIYALIARLQNALELSDDEAAEWRRVLPTLLDKADQGARPVEAALLYDLQRACMDHEQTIYTLDVAEWLMSAGHKPIRRPLDGQRFVRVPAQLRSATRRLAAARLSDADRQALAVLLRDAQNQAEKRLRARFRPVLTEALRDAGLAPSSLPEQAALAKTVEELLDRISTSGFLGFADVRDAIARGQMKLPDLSGPQEYVRGDPLLRLDRRLASLLDGVYRRAESYTRLLERTTAFCAGTETGRWVMRNVALPFGGALLSAEFLWMLRVEKDLKHQKQAERDAARSAAEAAGAADPDAAVAGIPDVTALEKWNALIGGWNTEWWFHLGWIVLGLVFLAVIRSAELRATLLAAGRGVYRVARFVFWDVPVRVYNNPLVRELVATLPAQLALNYLLKPVLLTGLLWWAFDPLLNSTPALVITFVASAFLVNSRIGHAIEAILLEASRAIMELVRSTPAVLRWVSDFFRELLDALEWVLARAEDWLRLRGRGGPVSITVRAVAGVVWMPFAFLIRFYTVVLVEPMVNPLKLPLTLVFAKFVYPLLAVAGVFTFVTHWGAGGLPSFEVTAMGVDTLSGVMPYWVAFALVVSTFWLLPDAFTYLFWEMRENWRLYKANHPTRLRPVRVGPHGESVKGLLHYGFHSGTVPRLYGKLRVAEREAARTDVWRDARTHRQALRGVEEAVRQFVTRDFLAVLNNPAAAWGGPQLQVGFVHLGTNRIRLELVPEEGGTPAWLEWEDRSGWLVAGWAETGFLDTLPPAACRVLENSLAYLYKRAGVDVIREQVRAELPREAVHFDADPDGMLVWYGSRESTPLLYDINEPVDEFRPRSPVDHRPVPGPTLAAERVLFSRVRLTWATWTGVWRPAGPELSRPRFGPAGWELTLLPRPHTAEPPARDPLSFSEPSANGHHTGFPDVSGNGTGHAGEERPPKQDVESRLPDPPPSPPDVDLPPTL